MASPQQESILTRVIRGNGGSSTQADREALIKPYLPSAPTTKPPQQQQSLRLLQSYSIRSVINLVFHRLIYHIVQLLFTIYIRLRQFYHALTDRLLAVLYYHHRTPELIHKDIRKLNRLPKHLSVIVDLKSDLGGDNDSSSTTSRSITEPEALAKLIDDVAEVSAWCACAGIPLLSVYEATGALKTHIPSLHRRTARTFRAYFPPGTFPTLHIRAPHHSAYSPPTSPATRTPTSISTTPSETTNLNILLLSASDGRTTLVDLTKTLAEMAQRGKLSPGDVSAELIDAELTEACCGEPDLLVVMAKSRGASWGVSGGGMRGGAGRRRGAGKGEERGGVVGGDLWLRGYPPWQVRLTEIFHVPDNSMGVGYQVFLRALHRYASAEMRFGR